MERLDLLEGSYSVLGSVCRRKAQRIIKRGIFKNQCAENILANVFVTVFTIRRCRLTVNPFIRATSSGLAPI